MQTSVQVVLPQKSTVGEIGTTTKAIEEKLKCLYLLHGLSDDQTIWMRRTSIERYATEYGFCVVMPFGGRSFYADEKQGLKYYTYIAKELPEIIEAFFNVSRDKKGRFIGGNSMGGYGALKIALIEKDRYAAAFGLSSVTNIYNEFFTDTLKHVFGETIPNDADLYKIIQKHEKDASKPKLYMTIGKKDVLYEDHVKFQKFMEGKPYDFTCIETNGEHSWSLWDLSVQSALEWISRIK